MMLTYDQPPRLDDLQRVAANALADFRVRWERGVTVDEARSEPLPVLRHAFPRYVIPRDSAWWELPLASVLSSGGRWHLQIEHEGRPRYYCRILFDDDRWRPSWFGYRWAPYVARGVRRLSDLEHRWDSRVVLVSSRHFQFTTFWIQAPDLHLVVSSKDDFLGDEGRIVTGSLLRELLVKRFREEAR